MDKDQLIKLVKNRPWFVQGFNGLPLYLHNVAANTGWMVKKDFGANYSHFFLEMHESRARWYYDELDMANVGHGYYKKIKNIKKLTALELLHKKDYLKARKVVDITKSQNLSTLSLKELVTLAQKSIHELTMSVSFAHAQEGISFVSEMKLKEILDRRNMNTHDNFQLLSSPAKASFLAEAQTLLWNIRKSSGVKKEKLISQFLKEFSWIDNSYVRGKTITEKDVLEKAKQQKTLPSEIALGKTRIQKQKLIKQLQLKPGELFVVQTIETTTSWQDTRKKFIMQSIGRMEPVIEALSKRLGMQTEHFKYICPKEVTYKNLTSKVFLANLAKRWPQGIFYSLKDTVLVFTGKDAAFIEKQVAQVHDKGITELKGMVANKGKVAGRVRIIRKIHDILKVVKGEILVASMTRPEFLPAMQKAAAFVTDEGGVTSHAAIISREMNKPCIIGTKIATQVLTDGEMVEVDANKGIIKKL
jgi:phosphoenolpyruvate synthase/pyruvate phosphate dikinase